MSDVKPRRVARDMAPVEPSPAATTGEAVVGEPAPMVTPEAASIPEPPPAIAAAMTEPMPPPAIAAAAEAAADSWSTVADAQSAPPEPRLEVTAVHGAPGSLSNDRAVTAQIAQTLLFILCILLSGMLLSQLIEEKSNKIIEVIAAAIPIDAMFVGKLFAMLAASVTGLIVWISAGALLVQMIKHGGVATLPPPAVGWPTFLILSIAYFGMNYLLLGAAFLTIGAQASTAREVQTMSMPVTFGQMLLLLLASMAIGAPNSPAAIAGAIFPLSSPLTMLARAAEEPTLWPHFAALLWQALWVAIIIRLGSRLFRRTVLKSGARLPWWRFGRAY